MNLLRKPIADKLLLLAILLTANSVHATVTIDPGVTEVFLGSSTSVQIPISAVGGDAVTDLTGAVTISGGATITSVSYTGSVWEAAPGGHIDFFPGFSPPGTTIDPNLSLLASGQTIAASGNLLTITVDITGLPAGDYPITLSATPAGSTKLYTTGGDEVPTNLLPGVLRIAKKPIVAWRETEFPADFNTPSAEATIWGDNADPDCDCIINFLEFAWGTDPNVANSAPATSAVPGLPQMITVEDGGQTYPAIAYSRNITSPCHSEEIGISTNLLAWDYTETSIVQVGTPVAHSNGTTEYVVKRSTIALSAAARTFLKTRVTGTHP